MDNSGVLEMQTRNKEARSDLLTRTKAKPDTVDNTHTHTHSWESITWDRGCVQHFHRGYESNLEQSPLLMPN